MSYPTSKELATYESMDFSPEHASALTGKVRILSFTYTATEASTGVMLAKLPAGRARALPLMSYYQTTGVTGNVTIGTGAYTSSMPTNANTVDQVVAEDKTALSTSTAVVAGTVQFKGPVEGLAYHSLGDVPVILYGTVPVGATVKGYLAYCVS